MNGTINTIISTIDNLAFKVSPKNVEMGWVILSIIAIIVISAIIIYKKKVYKLIK